MATRSLTLKHATHQGCHEPSMPHCNSWTPSITRCSLCLFEEVAAWRHHRPLEVSAFRHPTHEWPRQTLHIAPGRNLPLCTTAGFQVPTPQGKYNHPWIKQLPTGRARVYDVMYKGATTVLALAFAYGLFETGRGSYHILTASRERANTAKVQREEGDFERMHAVQVPMHLCMHAAAGLAGGCAVNADRTLLSDFCVCIRPYMQEMTKKSEQ